MPIHYFDCKVKLVTTKAAFVIISLLMISGARMPSAYAGSWPVTGITNVSASSSIDSTNPAVAADVNGNPLSVWNENGQIYAAKYFSGWKQAKIISSQAVFNSNPTMATVGGTIFAAWEALIYGNQEILLSMTDDGINWTMPVDLSENVLLPCREPDVCVDASGVVHVVWESNGDIFYRSSADKGAHWSTKIIFNESVSCYQPEIAAGPGNKLHVVYEYNLLVDPNTQQHVKEIYHRSSANGGASWSTAANISSSTSYISELPDISVDRSGTVVVAWQEVTGSDTEIFWNKNSGTWTTPQNLSNSPSLGDFSPALMFSKSGEFRAVWSRRMSSSPTGDSDIYGRTYRLGAWSATPQIVADNSGQSEDPAIADNGSGNSILAWADNTTTPANFEIYAGQTAGGFTLLTTGFETDTLGASGSAWSVGDDKSANGLVYWDEIAWTAHNSSKSAWCAGIGGDLTNHKYKPDMSAFMKIDIDLTNFRDAELRYYWKLPSADSVQDTADTGALNVWLGTTLIGRVDYQDLSTNWVESIVDLTGVCGRVVTLDWRWGSDSSQEGEGFYIDDINMTGNVKEPTDTIAPSKVSDLRTSDIKHDSATLLWTAPGDDSIYGASQTYDVRYASVNITDQNWDQASQATGEPAPKEGGNAESFAVNSLQPLTKYYFAVRALDDGGNQSEISNVVNATTMAQLDLTPPTPISDLEVTTAGLDSISLSWTATGDDGTSGKASTYDLRYSGSPITVGNWASATQATNEPIPSFSGVTESMTVTGLSPAGSYYFAIKAIDEANNASSLSNIPLGQTTTIEGDVNRDRTVDILDLVIVGKAFGATPGQSNWDIRADAKRDNVIDILDLVIIGKNFGKTV